MEIEAGQDLELKTLALTALDEAKKIAITDAESYKAAGEFWNYCRAKANFAREKIEPRVNELHKAHKNMVALMKECVEPWENAAKFIKTQRMIPWDMEQERQRQILQARIDAENKKKMQEQQLQLAAELEKAGLKQEAAAAIEEPPEVQPTILEKAVPKVEGFKYRTVWDFEIVDVKQIPAEYMVPDLVRIGAVVRALKQAVNIPGIRVFERKV